MGRGGKNRGDRGKQWKGGDGRVLKGVGDMILHKCQDIELQITPPTKGALLREPKGASGAGGEGRFFAFFAIFGGI